MNMYKQVDNHVELCISPSLEKEIRRLFDKEIDSGVRSVLDDGRILFSFDLAPEKSALLHLLSGWEYSPRTSDQLDSKQVHEKKECIKPGKS
jgi:hypothetical protein